ncbi:amidohydrolase [Arthrobacter sp. NPDC058130]|uniref:amidohydrolase n=1 Tax=Arthrobacter sp. NPDC058130 TaxID=3346353 RepID=UPI0036EBBA9D
MFGNALRDLELTDEETLRMHKLYRHLHANPELSMQEHRTARLISDHLIAIGAETFSCGGTGVVGVLRNGVGPVVGFRADIDGLPIKEETGLDFASQATGALADGTQVPVMHGCGHDMHITAALTAAALLAGATDAWSGTLVFLFQPGEETAAGAQSMVDDGLWNRAPKPEVIYGQHVMPSLAGTVSISRGTAMAMATSWKVTVRGRQAHGSQPQEAIDPIVLGAHILVRLQTIVSRELDPMQSAVVTIGTFHGGLKENIIPAMAEFTLNVRTFDQKVHEAVLASIRRIIRAEAEASSAPPPEIEELYSFPLCYNDPTATDQLIQEFRVMIGEEEVREIPPMMASEDFGTLATAISVPSVYWTFGGYTAETLKADGHIAGNHSPQFAPALEPTLSTGVRAAMTAILSKVGC